MATFPVSAAFKTASGKVLSLVNSAVEDDGTETEILSGGVNQNNQVGVNFGQYGVNETITSGLVFTGSGAISVVAWLESPSGNVMQPLPIGGAGTINGMPALCAPVRLMTGMSLKVKLTEVNQNQSYVMAYSPTKSDIFFMGTATGGGAEDELVSVKTGQSIGNSMVGSRVTKIAALGNIASDGAATALWPFAYVKAAEGFVKEAVGLTSYGSDDISGLDGLKVQTFFSDCNYLVAQNDKLYMTLS